MSKKLKALIAAPKPSSPLIAQTLSCRLQNGGELDLTIRKSSLGEIIDYMVLALHTLQLDREMIIEVTFSYWQLDEDLHNLTIEVGRMDAQCEDDKRVLSEVAGGLIAEARGAFMQRLAMNQIKLIGIEGNLEVPS